MQLDEEEQLTLYGIIHHQINRNVHVGLRNPDAVNPDSIADAAEDVTDAVIAFFKDAHA